VVSFTPRPFCTREKASRFLLDRMLEGMFLEPFWPLKEERNLVCTCSRNSSVEVIPTELYWVHNITCSMKVSNSTWFHSTLVIHSFLQSEFFTECDLVFPLSVYTFFSRLPFPSSSPSMTYFRRQFLLKLRIIQLTLRC
jgi:hypothetical protein